MVDRLLVFRIQRNEVVRQEVVHTTCNHTRANAVRTNDMERLISVDPLTVRFTHDRISAKFRYGGSLDYTIQQLIDREISKDDFPPIEVSLVAMDMGKRERNGTGKEGRGVGRRRSGCGGRE